MDRLKWPLAQLDLPKETPCRIVPSLNGGEVQPLVFIITEGKVRPLGAWWNRDARVYVVRCRNI
jgi:hypothetical protein